MKRKAVVCGIVALALFAAAGAVWAQDTTKAAAPIDGGADMDAMMKEWAKWAMPAEPHKQLEKMVGNWTTTTKMWMDPAAAPMESKGTAAITMVLGGRWARQEYHGDMMGMPFEGLGMTGYDNFKKLYVSTWMDNMTTALMHQTGTANADGSELTLSGLMDEPITGERDKKFKSIFKWTGADSFVFEAYDNIPGQGEIRVMEITYTRAK